tara:strand:+ start:2206 stop:2751 length:546 start_codon:yes stop_codon:yes gene_type:complete
MSKFKLTYVDKKILDFKEVDDSESRDFYEESMSIDEFVKFTQSNNISIEDNLKIAFRHSQSSKLKEIFLVDKQNKLPAQYVFDSEKQAMLFAQQQGLELSVHLQPQNVKDIIANFFSGGDCDFPGYQKIKENYEKELEKAGGESCTKCAKNRIVRKYQEIIVDAMSDKPKNAYSVAELKNK